MMSILIAAALFFPLDTSAADELISTASDAPFPSAGQLFGDEADPLSSLSTRGEDLRDAVASPASINALQAGLNSPSAAARLAAVRASSRLHNTEAVPHLSRVLILLDEPSQIRAAAALALGRIGDEKAVPALAEALKDPTPEVRYAAALSLGRLPADGVATRLERVLRADPSWLTRYAAAIALGRTRKAFVVLSLAAALNGDPAWQVRQQAARSLQDLGTPHAAQALVPALRDPEPSVRAAVGAALAEIGGPAQRRAVVMALRDETDPSVRTVLAVAASRATFRP